MPIALPGTFPILLAQAPALCGAAPIPPASPPREVAIVQRDDAFVIVATATVAPVVEPVSTPVIPAATRLGSTVSIDPTLVVSDRQPARGAAR
ncbi:hypothetical protein QLH51_12980 [Sphingomonas sp. 2R-10]|uniref:hypothetical protein n=1 Tax=Sphingomonas sp. 2R-10 TaxID=3045148 RepID=UPI000F76FC93|nr:hypothetical protein [Sphingomonas sp. 2R-10]MDJ0277712.1 hypothetical protein [Sphingomonas sp. 2R-10]